MASSSSKWAEKIARRLFIGGNWKSNGTMKSTQTLVKDVVNKIEFDTKKMEVLVSPIYIHLPEVKKILNKKVLLSAQNISAYGNGAYTGEIAAVQLKDLGINWTIIGHSERRTLFKETDDVIANKVKLAIDTGLGVVFCIGEKLAEREAGKTLDVCLTQMAAVSSNT